MPKQVELISFHCKKRFDARIAPLLDVIFDVCCVLIDQLVKSISEALAFGPCEIRNDLVDEMAKFDWQLINFRL